MTARFDLSLITRRYFPHFTRTRVNEGWCYVWAWMARVHVGERAQLCMALSTAPGRSRGHAFVRIEDRYYDSERPRGVPRYEALPCITRYVGAQRRLLRDVGPDRFLLTCDEIEKRDGRFATVGLARWPARIPGTDATEAA